MRTDDKGFKLSGEAKQDGFTQKERARRASNRIASSSRINDDGSSQSGHERNHLFLSDGGRQFADISALGAVDSKADGRSFAVWDLDRDGWLDLAVVNANTPLLEVYRNRIGELTARENHFVALRFEGGARPGLAGDQRWSARDGYGALVRITLPDGTRLTREHRCGEGFAAQNSATLLVGVGEIERIPRIEVRWPSGRTTHIEDVPADQLVRAFENPTTSPSGETFLIEPYGDQRP